MASHSGNSYSTRYSLIGRLDKWNDEDGWREFYEIYSRFIRTLALKSGLSRAEAEDVVQETVVSVAKEIHNFQCDRSLGSFRGWLHRIVRRRIADHFRKGAIKRRVDSKAGEDNDEGVDVSEVGESVNDLEVIWEAEWNSTLLKMAMDLLKHKIREEQYQLFDCYVLKGWPVSKVARTFRVSATKVYLTKHRVMPLVTKEVARLRKKVL